MNRLMHPSKIACGLAAYTHFLFAAAHKDAPAC
jgi:hypothetical protein